MRRCGQEGDANDLSQERLLKTFQKLKGDQLTLTPFTYYEKRFVPRYRFTSGRIESSCESVTGIIP